MARWRVLFALLFTGFYFSGELRAQVDATDGVEFGPLATDPAMGKNTEGGLDLEIPDGVFRVFGNGEIKPQFKAGEGFTNTAVAGTWYRIAQTSPSGAGNGFKRSNAQFTIRDNVSGGGHSNLVLRAGISYGNSGRMGLTVLSHTGYNRTTFTHARVLEKGTYDRSYLEVYVKYAGEVSYSISDNLADGGWEPVDWEPASIPSGYTVNMFNVDRLFMVGSNTERFSVSRTGIVNVAGSLNVSGGVNKGGYPVLTGTEVNPWFKDNMMTFGTMTGSTSGGMYNVYSESGGTGLFTSLHRRYGGIWDWQHRASGGNTRTPLRLYSSDYYGSTLALLTPNSTNGTSLYRGIDPGWEQAVRLSSSSSNYFKNAVGIGAMPESGKTFHVEGDAKISGGLTTTTLSSISSLSQRTKTGWALEDPGYGSTASGFFVSAPGASSAALGWGVRAAPEGNQIVLGAANEEMGAGMGNLDPDYPIVVVGNGTSAFGTANRSNVMVIRRNRVEILEDVTIEGEATITKVPAKGGISMGEFGGN